jgi:hypothetical protein
MDFKLAFRIACLLLNHCQSYAHIAICRLLKKEQKEGQVNFGERLELVLNLSH